MEASGNTPAKRGLNFIFKDAPIEAVLNEVLGEAFGQTYTLQPGITGTISIRLDGINSAQEAINSLNTALSLQGYEIVELESGLIIARAGQFQAGTQRPVLLPENADLPAGASLAVIQLKHGNIEKITDVAGAILGNGVLRFSDDASGIVVLGGEAEQVASAVDLLKSLDVDWLSAMSTAFIPVQNTTPTELASDLEPVFSRMGGVSVVPIDRLQRLMLFARSAQALDQARAWIARLDEDARPQVMRDVLVYEARYVNAEDLIQLTDSTSTSNYPTLQDSPSNATEANRPPAGYERSQGSSFSTPFGGYPYKPETKSLYENLSIRVDTGRNAIVARGATDELQSLSDLLTLLDKPKRQVLIKATIVEVSLSDGSSLGVQWDLVEDRLAATFSDSTSGNLTSRFPGISISYLNTDIGAVVNALASTSDVEIVSSPRMQVLNNETARLQVGDQVPIITQSAVSVTDPGAPVVNSTTYRDTGVILTVTPRIRAGGMVEVDISQEVSGVSETTTSSIDSPTISQRSIESVLSVPDGATAVLGGLMSSTRSYTQSGVPVLKDTPILGPAFRSTTKSDRRTELVILIEPTVVFSEAPEVDIPKQLRLALERARRGPAS
ncbi:hypothetical protein HY29_17895 [Hyphomonas beringensis]|uniref:NolW-like domain-containing protein n=1 Tax=Hyphomonas beringensis TaxID=1280946 RepID=A0A062U873_9PROT|nr:hypothetical protein HY29_17895 [Hyphomonas beringensis]